jgi:hypothetical protein
MEIKLEIRNIKDITSSVFIIYFRERIAIFGDGFALPPNKFSQAIS